VTITAPSEWFVAGAGRTVGDQIIEFAPVHAMQHLFKNFHFQRAAHDDRLIRMLQHKAGGH
jgi:hypothetical protein